MIHQCHPHRHRPRRSRTGRCESKNRYTGLRSRATSGHRYYTPSTGRFLNSDPVHELAFKLALIRAGDWKPGSNAKEHERYTFVGNDPLGRIDRLGLENVQMVATTVIRPPDAEQGVKTKHVVVVNEYGPRRKRCLSQPSFQAVEALHLSSRP